jgi:hypothetical protein
MHFPTLTILFATLALAAPACGSKGDDSDESTSTSTGTTTTTCMIGEPPTSGVSATETTGDPSSSSPGSTTEPDGPATCDILEQNCGPDTACYIEFSLDDSWHAICKTTNESGPTCHVEGGKGIDGDCAEGEDCVVRPGGTEAGASLCKPLCKPSEGCAQGATCVPVAAGVDMGHCHANCDPLDLDCDGEGEKCVPLRVGDAEIEDFACEDGDHCDVSELDGFVCAYQRDPQQYLAPCGTDHSCAPFFQCMEHIYLNGCEFTSCCTPYCDINDGCAGDFPENQTCTALDPGAPWMDVGVCTML